MSMEKEQARHVGRFGQIGIYLGKQFRMLIYHSDWKVLPMAAVIAGLVAMVTGKNTFVTMEGTQTGTFALTLVCIWNGFFNSIQAIVRERPIVKREHRAGMHITSYVAAHLIYQLFLCALQAAITLGVCISVGMHLPEKSLITSSPYADIYITLLLITFSADTMSLMVSAIVRTTTTAMTAMPFLLIIQLVFSGQFFSLPASVSGLADATISKWGMTALCIQADVNNLPSTLIWNKLVAAGDYQITKNVRLIDILSTVQENGGRETFMKLMADMNQNANYVYDSFSLLSCWGYLLLFAFAFSFIAVVFLEFIDRDKR